MEFPAGGEPPDKMVRLHMRHTDMKFGVGHVICPVRQSVKSTALQAVGPGSTPGQGTSLTYRATKLNRNR